MNERMNESYVPIDRFLPMVMPVRMLRGKISFGHERWLYLRVIPILAVLAILAILTIVLNIVIVVTVVIRITIMPGTALSSAS